MLEGKGEDDVQNYCHLEKQTGFCYCWMKKFNSFLKVKKKIC